MSALDSHLTELTGPIHVIDLRRDQTLDALGLDDQVSTSRPPETLIERTPTLRVKVCRVCFPEIARIVAL